MAVGSLLLQGASFLTIIALKPSLTEELFAFFITQISWASIIGSITTLRFEILLFQEEKKVDKTVLFSTLIIALCVLVICGIAMLLLSHFAGGWLNFSPMMLVLAFGFGMIEGQSFLGIQMQRVFDILLTRGMQAAVLGLTALLAWSGIVHESLFTLYALGTAGPVFFWFFYAISRAPGKLVFRLPPFRSAKRSFALTLSVLVNTVYANGPIVLASATQSANFIADFGFILRLLTGPITMIRQAFGHTYLAKAFKIEPNSNNSANYLWNLTCRTMARSIAVYLAILCVIVPALIFSADIFGIYNYSMIIYLSFATIFQVSVNTIAGSRSVTESEFNFLVLDLFRVISLYCAIYFVTFIRYDLVFAITSSLLYIIYIIINFYEIRRWGLNKGARLK